MATVPWLLVLLLAACCALSAAVHAYDDGYQADITVGPVHCPHRVQHLSAPYDLSTVQPGTTYLLAPGQYSLSTKLSLIGSAACFIGKSQEYGDVVLTAPPGKRFFDVFDGAVLGLKQLVLEGQGAGGGMFVNGSTLATVDLTVQNCVTTTGGGGAIYLDRSTATLLGHTQLSGNSASEPGGALVTYDTKLEICNELTVFNNSAGLDAGGLLLAEGSTVTIKGVSRWVENRSPFNGGAIRVFEGTLNLVGGEHSFYNNSAGADGSAIKNDYGKINIKSATLKCVSGTSNIAAVQVSAAGANLNVTDSKLLFAGNKAASSCAGLQIQQGANAQIRRSHFEAYDNEGLLGAALWVFVNSNLAAHDSSFVFKNNKVPIVGGAIYIAYNATADLGDVTAIDNEAALRGGAIYMDGNAEEVPIANLTIHGHATFDNNAGGQLGGAVAVDGSQLFFKGPVTLKGNRAASGAAVWTAQYVFEGKVGSQSRIVFNGPFCAQDNIAATAGGAGIIQVDAGGVVEFSPSADAIGKQNAANNTSPAIVAVNATVSCGAGSSRQQPALQRDLIVNEIEGPVCSCITGGSCTCPADTRWVAEACRCAIPCDPDAGGRCCDKFGAIKPEGSVCRHPEHPCDAPDFCDGHSPHCPDLDAPDGAKCAWHSPKHPAYGPYSADTSTATATTSSSNNLKLKKYSQVPEAVALALLPTPAGSTLNNKASAAATAQDNTKKQPATTAKPQAAAAAWSACEGTCHKGVCNLGSDSYYAHDDSAAAWCCHSHDNAYYGSSNSHGHEGYDSRGDQEASGYSKVTDVKPAYAGHRDSEESYDSYDAGGGHDQRPSDGYGEKKWHCWQ